MLFLFVNMEIGLRRRPPRLTHLSVGNLSELHQNSVMKLTALRICEACFVLKSFCRSASRTWQFELQLRSRSPGNVQKASFSSNNFIIASAVSPSSRPSKLRARRPLAVSSTSAVRCSNQLITLSLGLPGNDW